MTSATTWHRPRPRRRWRGRSGRSRNGAPRTAPRRRRRDIDPDAARRLLSERAQFADRLDRELQLACRMEAMGRRELGDAARVFVRHRLYHRVGFVCLGDYARERLGISARTVQEAAWMATRLDALPAVSTAFDRSEISWTQARLICEHASAADAQRWVALARRHTVDALARIAARAHPLPDVPPAPDPGSREMDGEPAVRWRLACPARVRALWRRARELASRMAGAPLAEWQAAEIIAAEGFSGRPAGASIADRALLDSMRLARRARRSVPCDARADPASQSAADEGHDPPTFAVDPDPVDAGGNATDAPPALTPANPFALDARLVAAMDAIRKSEPDMGRLLRVMIDHRFYRLVGFRAFDGYVREHLGISTRKAWALVKLDRATSRSDDFARAYADGTLSWARALTLLPVLDRANAEAWIARAHAVTVRRLADEVNAVLAARDTFGRAATLDPPLDPALDPSLDRPSLDAPALSSHATSATEAVQIGAHAIDTVQIRAHATDVVRRGGDALAQAADACRRALSEVCDVEIQFTAPTSVIALVRDALDAFADPGAPRWTALDALLRHVIAYWESTPRHRDPIFERDGWRCTVPACSSRRSLHDHHLVFRSRGGGNARVNRTTICAAHHLHGVHAGTIRAWGEAPDAIRWELGVRSGAPPLLTYVGDRRCPLGNDPLRDDAAPTQRTG